MTTRYLKHVCYCPSCRRRHEGVITEEMAQQAVDKTKRSRTGRGYYLSPLDNDSLIAAAHLPRVECDACCRKRVGPENYEEIKECERMALANSATGQSTSS